MARALPQRRAVVPGVVAFVALLQQLRQCGVAPKDGTAGAKADARNLLCR